MNMFQRLFTVVDASTPTFLLCKAITFLYLNDKKNPLVRDSISALRLRQSFVANDSVTLCPLDINTYTPIQIACQLSPIKGYLERNEDKEKGLLVLEDEIEDEFGEVQLVTDYTDVMEEADLTQYVVVRVDEKKKEADEGVEKIASESRGSAREIVSFALLGLNENEREATVASMKKKAEVAAEATEEQNEEEIFQLMKTRPEVDMETGRSRVIGIDTRFVTNPMSVDEEDDAEKEMAQEMLNNLAETMKQKADDQGAEEQKADEQMASDFDMSSYLDMTRYVLEQSNETIQVNREQQRLTMAGLVVSEEDREVIRAKEKEEWRKEEEERRRQAERMNPIRRKEMEEKKKELQKRKEAGDKQREDQQKTLTLTHVEELGLAKEKTKPKSKPKPKTVSQPAKQPSPKSQEPAKPATSHVSPPTTPPMYTEVVPIQNWVVENVDEDAVDRPAKKAKKAKGEKENGKNDQPKKAPKAKSKKKWKDLVPPSSSTAGSSGKQSRSASEAKIVQVVSRLQDQNSYLVHKLGNHGHGSDEANHRSSTTSLNDLRPSGRESEWILGTEYSHETIHTPPQSLRLSSRIVHDSDDETEDNALFTVPFPPATTQSTSTEQNLPNRRQTHVESAYQPDEESTAPPNGLPRQSPLVKTMKQQSSNPSPDFLETPRTPPRRSRQKLSKKASIAAISEAKQEPRPHKKGVSEGLPPTEEVTLNIKTGQRSGENI
ncbi:hypothetical protein BLNAU_17324 [Blattamonas nauphoetae]|uniref:Uncharacterized protein n=1 Tax=Blattamonas nauphoetae TaxID=2049346 RepID=A0ABQ9XA34_9EUKA|nr:hypothetical protein BLNAU_17324 [Blattamonas nauphoetae]